MISPTAKIRSTFSSLENESQGLFVPNRKLGNESSNYRVRRPTIPEVRSMQLIYILSSLRVTALPHCESMMIDITSHHTMDFNCLST